MGECTCLRTVTRRKLPYTHTYPTYPILSYPTLPYLPTYCCTPQIGNAAKWQHIHIYGVAYAESSLILIQASAVNWDS